MKQITIELEDDEWREIEQMQNYWNDESYPIHAAYYFRDALIRAGYLPKE